MARGPKAAGAVRFGDGARPMRRDRRRNRRDMGGRGAAAAADDVDQAGFREFAESARP